MADDLDTRMSAAKGFVKIGDTSMEWDEYKDRIEFRGHCLTGSFLINTKYDGAREFLDCLMVLFGRTELATRYPEAR